MATHLSDLKQDPRNARRHSSRNLAAVTTAISEVGFMRSLVAANDGTLIAGNLTAEALADLGMDDVIVVRSDGTKPIVHIREDVDPGSELAIKGGIYDNRASELADGWNEDVLAALMAEVDVSPVLMTQDELAAIIAQLPTDADWEGSIGGLPDGDKAPFEQMTFTLSTLQAVSVRRALVQAKAAGDFNDTGNENSNGNALAAICEAYGG